jgi:hypothetical protein
MSQTFLRHERISVKIMALLRSSWCSTCHYIVVILSASISNPCQNIRVKIESNSKNTCRKTIYSRISSNNTICVHILQYKQFFSKEDLCTYCLQYCVILSHLIAKQELNNYTMCLWFLKGLSEKKQAKVVRQVEIKMSVSDTFCLNAVLKTTEQMCEEKKSLNVLHNNNNSMKTLQKLINQQWEETTVINKSIHYTYQTYYHAWV